MIIIVEGPDNSGKTTFALALAKKLRAVFIKAERPDQALDLLSYQGIIEHAQKYSGFVVSDRHLAISEPIYGSAIRGGHSLKPEDIEVCLKRIHAVVYCRPPTEVIMATLADREQMDGVQEKALDIIGAYDHYMESLHLDMDTILFVYDYKQGNVGEMAEKLKSYARAYSLASYPHGSSSPW